MIQKMRLVAIFILTLSAIMQGILTFKTYNQTSFAIQTSTLEIANWKVHLVIALLAILAILLLARVHFNEKRIEKIKRDHNPV